MGILSSADQQRAIKRFFDAEVKNLETATEVAIKVTATKLANETSKQLRKFKIKNNSNFAKSVKVYNLKARGALGPASFVRIGAKFSEIFQEGGLVFI